MVKRDSYLGRVSLSRGEGGAEGIVKFVSLAIGVLLTV